MRRTVVSTVRTGVALAVALAGAAAARAQLPTVSIEDPPRVVEASGGVSVTVTLSFYPGSPVTVGWRTGDGSAIAGQDYLNSGSTVTFSDANPRTFTVSLIDDGVDEWNPLHMDEAFFIDLDPPATGNATLLKRRATVTIVDDDRPLPGLQFVSAVADGSLGVGRVRLQWRVPASTESGPPNDVVVRWDKGPTCTIPTSTTGGVDGFRLSDPPTPIPVKAAGETQVVEHTGLAFDRYCYALFAIYSGTPTTEPATIIATPFAADAGPVAWAYSTGFPNVVAPAVGQKAVYTVSTDGVVHAMERTSGAWPTSWNPVSLGRDKAASNRSPVVPLPHGQRLLIGTESGEVHAVDGGNGSIAWSRSATFNGQGPLFNLGGVQATPAGLFTSFGGQNDVVLVGTHGGTSNNTFYMLDPATGTNKSTFSNGSMGAMLGMAAVDYLGYPNNRVYFLTNATNGTLWAFDIGAGLAPSTLAGGNPVSLGGANGSPVLRNGRLYFGLTNGQVVAYQLSNGQKSFTTSLGSEVKGFVFPDRRNGNLYLSTGTQVWCVADNVTAADPILSPLWVVGDIPSPSIVLHRPGTNYLYVGGGDGKLYEINVASPDPPGTKKSWPLEPGSWIGAPSLDGPNNLVLVGSSSGVVYAVRVPF